jgi:transposase
MWIPPEDADPVVFHASTRKKVGIFGAVSVTNGQLVVRKEDKFDASSFQNFLKQLLRHRKRNRKMMVILDNARWHHAKPVKPWLQDHRHVIELDFLPAYSPELNSIERVWKLTRSSVRIIATFLILLNSSKSFLTNSSVGKNPIRLSGDYAQLFKSLCIFK